MTETVTNEGAYSARGVLTARTEVARIMFPENEARYSELAENLILAGYVNMEAVLTGAADHKHAIETELNKKAPSYRSQR